MKYTEKHKLGDIINDHYQLLLVISRFGIPLGFGDKNVKTICQENNVDCNTFLTVLNYISNGDLSSIESVSVLAMTRFLRLSHQYYLDFFFPQLRDKLIAAMDGTDEKLSGLIIRFFDNFLASVNKHLMHEETAVLQNVEKMCNEGKYDVAFRIERYVQKHEQIDNTIQDLKNIIIKYFPDNGNANAMNSVLYDIFSCEVDLKTHCDIEDQIFVPLVRKLERDIMEA